MKPLAGTAPAHCIAPKDDRFFRPKVTSRRRTAAARRLHPPLLCVWRSAIALAGTKLPLSRVWWPWGASSAAVIRRQASALVTAAAARHVVLAAPSAGVLTLVGPSALYLPLVYDLTCEQRCVRTLRCKPNVSTQHPGPAGAAWRQSCNTSLYIVSAALDSYAGPSDAQAGFERGRGLP